MNKKTSIMLASLVIAVLAGGLALAFTGGNGSSASMCAQHTQTYTVTIENSHAPLTDVHGKLCDKITFINRDKLTRAISFGPHDDHVPYDGVGEKFLNQSQSFTITLNQAGTFHWHDHEHEAISGYFTVDQ